MSLEDHLQAREPLYSRYLQEREDAQSLRKAKAILKARAVDSLRAALIENGIDYYDCLDSYAIVVYGPRQSVAFRARPSGKFLIGECTFRNGELDTTDFPPEEYSVDEVHEVIAQVWRPGSSADEDDLWWRKQDRTEPIFYGSRIELFVLLCLGASTLMFLWLVLKGMSIQ